jgi:hypothetical protein
MSEAVFLNQQASHFATHFLRVTKMYLSAEDGVNLFIIAG